MRSARSKTVTRVAGLVQLIGRGQARRARADDRDRLAGARRGRRRLDPAFLQRALDDRPLDRLDRDRVGVDAEHARAFARRRAEPAGELREVVGREQARRSPPASDPGRRGRSSPGSGCRAGSPDGRTGCRSPCSARPDRASTCVGYELVDLAPVLQRARRPGRAGCLLRLSSMKPVGLPISSVLRRARRTRRPVLRRAPRPRPPARACSRAASP